MQKLAHPIRWYPFSTSARQFRNISLKHWHELSLPRTWPAQRTDQLSESTVDQGICKINSKPKNKEYLQHTYSCMIMITHHVYSCLRNSGSDKTNLSQQYVSNCRQWDRHVYHLTQEGTLLHLICRLLNANETLDRHFLLSLMPASKISCSKTCTVVPRTTGLHSTENPSSTVMPLVAMADSRD